MEISSAPNRLRILPSWLLNQAALVAQRLVSQALEAVDARRPHYSLLAALDEFGPASQASVGRRCGIDRSDMVALVNELGRAGFVRRTADPLDARRNVITITASGRRRLALLDERVAEVEDELVGPLTERERRELVRLLTQLVEHHA